MAARTPSTYPSWQEKPGVTARVLKTLLLLVLAVVMLFPFVYVAAVSISSARDAAGQGLILVPKHPTLEAYRVIFRGASSPMPYG